MLNIDKPLAMTYFTDYRAHPNKATGRVQFDVQGMDLSVINGIRRTLLTDVPTVGLIFEKGQGFFYDKTTGEYESFTVEPTMEVVVNTGPLHNEFLLHRLSMIPVYLSEEDVDSYEPNSLMFEIEKTNKTAQIVPLTTHDITLMKNNVVIPADTVRSVHFPKNAWSKEPILITRLRPGESVHVFGNFVKSTARANAGMSPVSLCSFMPKLDTDKIKKENIQGILERERTFVKNDYGDPIAWTFEMETENGLSPGYLVDKALEILVFKIRRAYRTLTSDDLIVQALEPEGTYEYSFMNEDDTLGHLIQGFIHNNYYRPGELIDNRFHLSFIGYCCPHPLEAKMNVRLTFQPPEEDRTDITVDSITELVVRDFFKKTLVGLETHLMEIHREWCQFTGRPLPEAPAVAAEATEETTEEQPETSAAAQQAEPAPAPEKKKRAPKKTK